MPRQLIDMLIRISAGEILLALRDCMRMEVRLFAQQVTSDEAGAVAASGGHVSYCSDADVDRGRRGRNDEKPQWPTA
jgi:hypothetical protein